MANLLSNTTIGGYQSIHTGNIGSYAITSIPTSFSSITVTSSFDTASNDIYASMRVIRNNSAITDGMYIGYGNSGSGITRIFGGGSTGGALEKYATYTYEPGSFRAPIFYDANDTTYYFDGNSTTSLRTRGSWRADSADWDGEYSGKIQYHSNHWYFQSGNLWIFRNAGGGNVFQVDQSGNGTFSSDIYLGVRGTWLSSYLNQDVRTSASPSFSTVNLSTLNASDTNARYYVQSTNGVPSNNLGNPTVTEMALFDEQFNNKTAFYNPASLTFWTSSDGTNYTEYTGFDTTTKKRFLGGDNDSGVFIPNQTNRFRIEVENSAGYVFLNQLYIYWSSNSHSTKVHIWVRRCDNNQWYQHTDSNTQVSSWPGHLYLPFSTIPFYPGALASTGHFNKIRIEFIPTWSTGDYSTYPINLMRMQIWGGYPAGKRNIYSTDENQNVSFPATLSATTFSGALSGNATTASALTSMNISQFTNNSGYITGYTETDTFASVTGRGATTASQVSFTQTGDHAISVGTIRGRAVGVQGGEFIQLYERVNIGGPNGWGASNTSAPSYGLSVYGGATIGYGNSAGLAVTGRITVQNGNDSGTLYGPNSSWGAYLYVGAASNNVASTTAQVISTDGNLHIDSGSGSKQIYMNYYSGMVTGIYGGLNMQNTYITNASYIRSNTNIYTDQNYGYGLVGVYSASRYQGVFAMGDSYKLTADGTGTGTLYGIAWTHTNVGGQSKSGLGHQALFMDNGVTQTAIGSGIWTNGLITTTSYGTSANWNTAFGWGNHASAGYLTSLPSHTHDDRYYTESESDGRYIQYGSLSNSFGLNDNKLYLRTNGDTNHYLWNAADDWEELVYYTGTGFRVKGSTGTVSATFTDSGISIGTSSTLIRSFDAQGYLRIYGSSTNFLGVGPYNNNGWVYFENSGNANGVYFNSPGRYAFDSVDVTPYTDAENSLGNGSYRWANVYTSGWLRQYGAQGMYNQDYGTHFYSLSGAAWAITGSGGAVELQFRSNHQSTVRGYVYADTSNNIGFLNNGGNWSLRTDSSRDTQIYGALTVGSGTSADIYMTDTDETTRRIHTNSGRIGFLNSSSNWGAYCDNTGNWFSDHSMRAPIFYDSQDTNYYVDPNSTSNLAASYIGRVLINHDGTDTWFRMQSGNRMRITTTGGTDFIIPNTGEMSYNGNTVIHTGNIGSQSVSYASTAGALSSMNISQFSNNSGYLTGITSGQVTGALGYTPYNSSNPSGYITSGDTVAGLNTTFLGNATSNIGSGYTRVIRNENGAGGAPNYAPILHVAASDTMWQIAGAHAGQTTLVWRSGYSGAWNTPWWTIYHSGNFTDNSSNWNTAYGWGNHASAGYLTSLPSHNHDDRYYTETESDSRYLYYRGYSTSGNTQNFQSTANTIRFDQVGALDNGAWSNQPTGYYTYGGILSLRGASFGLQIYGSHTGDLAFKTQWDNDQYSGWRTIISSANIGSQSVSYASSAGNADTVDGYHATNAASGLAYYASNGYLYVPSWINVGSAGIYSSTNNAHIRPNTATYGAWEMIGSKNGWSGIYFNDSGDYLMANNNEVGHFQNGVGWKFRWYQGEMYISSGTTGGGTERTVIHSGNIGSQSVSYATTAGTANAVAWTNVSSRPTALSQFTNDLGNYGGFLTSITAHTHAISDVSGLQTALDSKQASLGFTPYNSTNPSGYITGISFANVSSKPTTVAGYGITDAITTANIGSQSVSNATTAGGLAVHGGRNNEANKIVRTDANGYIQAGWINSDSGNMGFATRIARIQCSDDNYIRFQTLTEFKVSMGLSGKNNYSRRIDYTADANYHVGSFGHAGTSTNDVWHYGSGFYDVWAGGGTFPGSMTHIHGFNAVHYSAGAGGNGYGWQMASQYDRPGEYYARNISGGTFSSWRQFITSDNIGSQSVSYATTAGTANAVAWTNVSSRPTALSQFSNDLGNYGGFLTSLPAHDHDRLFLTDSRGASRAPSYYDQRYAQWDFQNNSDTGAGGDGWHGLLTVAKWFSYDASHRQEQLAFTGDDLKRRTATSDSAWGSWKTIIDTGNVGSQSVNYANSAGSASTAGSATTAQQLTKFGDIYGQDWNSYFITGKLIVSNALGHTGDNRPINSYGYGTTLSYGETGGPLMQIYLPEDAGNTGGSYKALAFRSGYNGSWSSWKTVVDQVGNTCTIAGSNGTGVQIHSNVGYGQNPLTYFLLRGQADGSNWNRFKILLTGDQVGQDIEFRRINHNDSTDARMFYVPRGLNQVIFDYTVVQPSDSRLKDNLTPITNPVDKIKSLRGVEFDWNSGEHVGTHDVGLIAQDVEAVLPEAVTTQEDGYKNLAYTKVIPLLVEAMKEQQAMIEALKAEIELLKNK